MLTLERITKKYKVGESEVKALDGIDLHIEAGSFVAVVGKSGSGKSTLLNLIGALDEPTSGSIVFEGQRTERLSERKAAEFRRKNIGFVFQFFNLIPELDLRDNILISEQLCGKKHDETHFRYLTEALGISDRLFHLPGQLSGGERQRTAIARALISRPRLLLMDEPTGNLDDETSRRVIDMIRILKDELGQTVIMVTHDHESSSRADRIITLRSGRISGELHF